MLNIQSHHAFNVILELLLTVNNPEMNMSLSLITDDLRNYQTLLHIGLATMVTGLATMVNMVRIIVDWSLSIKRNVLNESVPAGVHLCL